MAALADMSSLRKILLAIWKEICKIYHMAYDVSLSRRMRSLARRSVDMAQSEGLPPGIALSSVRTGLTLGYSIAMNQELAFREERIKELNNVLENPDLREHEVDKLSDKLKDMNWPMGERSLFHLLSGKLKGVVGEAASMVYNNTHLIGDLGKIKRDEKVRYVIELAREQRTDLDRLDIVLNTRREGKMPLFPPKGARGVFSNEIFASAASRMRR